MNFSKFQISVILRISLIVFNAFAIVFTTYHNYPLIISGILSLALLMQSYRLAKQINKIHQYLTMFLMVIRESRDSYSLPTTKKDYIFSELSEYFKEIREVIKDAKIEKENQYHYLNYVVEHVGIGLLAFDDKGKVELINNAGKKLLKIPALLNIKTLDSIQKDLSESIIKMMPGQQETIVLNIEDELLHLSFKVSQFRMYEKNIRLVSFQNIKTELDEKELDSWQKLIRILNHEIMNSITPITTLSTTIKKSLTRKDTKENSPETNEELIADTVNGLSLIEERGKGLISFVQKYRSLSTAIKPNIEKVKVAKLISNVTTLLSSDLENEKIICDVIKASEDYEIWADEKLIEQVLINLIKNSIHAIHSRRTKSLIIATSKINGKITIEVADSGKGIPANELENIFIPFYTTKENGSGIGLSLSRQIMRLHKGSIKVSSAQNVGTTFTLTF